MIILKMMDSKLYLLYIYMALITQSLKLKEKTEIASSSAYLLPPYDIDPSSGQVLSHPECRRLSCHLKHNTTNVNSKPIQTGRRRRRSRKEDRVPARRPHRVPGPQLVHN